MNRRILGFQRRVWWPKWTPASSSSLRPISAIGELLVVLGLQPGHEALRTRRHLRRAGTARLGLSSPGRLLDFEKFRARFCEPLRWHFPTGRPGSPTPIGWSVPLTPAGGP